MDNVLLAISAVLLVSGAFLIFFGGVERRSSEAVRMGRIMRGGGIETVGLFVFLISWNEGAKPAFALPVLIVSLAIGTMFGVLHGVLTNRRVPPSRHRRH